MKVRRKAWKWEKPVSWDVKYHIIFKNIMKYGTMALIQGLKFTNFWIAWGVTSCPQHCCSKDTQINMRKILMLFSPSSHSSMTIGDQNQVLRLLLLLRPQQRVRRLVLQSMIQCWQHRDSSWMNSDIRLGFLSARRPQKVVRHYRLELLYLKQKQKIVAMTAYSQTKSPELITDTTQPLMERGATPDGAEKTVYG